MLAVKQLFSRSEDCDHVDGVKSEPFNVGILSPTGVCAVATPLHSLYQGSPNYDLRAKSENCVTIVLKDLGLKHGHLKCDYLEVS